MPKYFKYLYAVYAYEYIAANHMCISEAFVVQVNFRQAWFKSNFLFLLLYIFYSWFKDNDHYGRFLYQFT